MPVVVQLVEAFFGELSHFQNILKFLSELLLFHKDFEQRGVQYDYLSDNQGQAQVPEEYGLDQLCWFDPAFDLSQELVSQLHHLVFQDIHLEQLFKDL